MANRRLRKDSQFKIELTKQFDILKMTKDFGRMIADIQKAWVNKSQKNSIHMRNVAIVDMPGLIEDAKTYIGDDIVDTVAVLNVATTSKTPWWYWSTPHNYELLTNASVEKPNGELIFILGRAHVSAHDTVLQVKYAMWRERFWHVFMPEPRDLDHISKLHLHKMRRKTGSRTRDFFTALSRISPRLGRRDTVKIGDA